MILQQLWLMQLLLELSVMRLMQLALRMRLMQLAHPNRNAMTAPFQGWKHTYGIVTCHLVTSASFGEIDLTGAIWQATATKRLAKR